MEEPPREQSVPTLDHAAPGSPPSRLDVVKTASPFTVGLMLGTTLAGLVVVRSDQFMLCIAIGWVLLGLVGAVINDLILMGALAICRASGPYHWVKRPNWFIHLTGVVCAWIAVAVGWCAGSGFIALVTSFLLAVLAPLVVVKREAAR